MEPGWGAFGAELLRYVISAIVLLATIVAAVFAGAGIRKAVDKKKLEKESVKESTEA